MTDEIDTRASVASTRLNALGEQFSGFERQMAVETRARKDSDESALCAVRDNIARLEKTLNAEIKRRVEANKALQNMFESQMATVQDKLEAVFSERFDQLHGQVDSLNDRMSVVEKDFSASREQYVRDIEDKSAMLAKDVAALHQSFTSEKGDRKERETLIAAKLREHEKKANEKFASEAEICEQKYRTLREDLEESKSVRQTGDQKFQDYIIEEVAALKNGLVVESQTRESSDDDIVNALHHYTHALQEALKAVNQA